MPWAIKWRSENKLDGKREHLIGRYSPHALGVPPQLDGYITAVFRTRAEARAYLKKRYGYIAQQPDLWAEPHGWKMPQVVKVRVTVEELGSHG